jgi:hypothetical protein
MIEPNKKYKCLLQRVAQIGIAIPGTIRKVYLKCGKQNCCCMTGIERDRHGPYYFWDRKVNGRLTSLSIAKKDLALYKQYISNRKVLEKITTEILEVGCNLLTNLEKNRGLKIKKSLSSTRGK